MTIDNLFNAPAEKLVIGLEPDSMSFLSVRQASPTHFLMRSINIKKTPEKFSAAIDA